MRILLLELCDCIDNSFVSLRYALISNKLSGTLILNKFLQYKAKWHFLTVGYTVKKFHTDTIHIIN